MKHHFQNIDKALKTITDVTRNHLLAWKTSSFGLSFWCPPPCGTMKLNFEVATKDDFVVTAAVLSNDKGDILLAFTKKLNSLNVNKGEVMTALTRVDFALFNGCSKLMLEGDSLVTIMAINQPSLLSYWSFAIIIFDIQPKL